MQLKMSRMADAVQVGGPPGSESTVEAIERQAKGAHEGGLELDGLPDLPVEGERDDFYQAQLIRQLAVRHVTSWTGWPLYRVRRIQVMVRSPPPPRLPWRFDDRGGGGIRIAPADRLGCQTVF
jgi:hypothetical protein